MKTDIKALIIDDETDICFLLSGILHNRGIETKWGYSLSEAKAILKTYNPSIIFLDNHLPDGLGIDFVNFLKKNLPMVKIVMITGQEMNINHAFGEGISEIIFKPFTSEKIFSVLEHIE